MRRLFGRHIYQMHFLERIYWILYQISVQFIYIRVLFKNISLKRHLQNVDIHPWLELHRVVASSYCNSVAMHSLSTWFFYHVVLTRYDVLARCYVVLTRYCAVLTRYYVVLMRYYLNTVIYLSAELCSGNPNIVLHLISYVHNKMRRYRYRQLNSYHGSQ